MTVLMAVIRTGSVSMTGENGKKMNVIKEKRSGAPMKATENVMNGRNGKNSVMSRRCGK
ncbi:hypothetical protein [Propionispora hippei]|uniref:hypothetical protein n=1 Tax=Propionispora hippei TaxID=209080 RepID=UPI00165F685E|nr:hypothetical protein [Propionispora hippei]